MRMMRGRLVTRTRRVAVTQADILTQYMVPPSPALSSLVLSIPLLMMATKSELTLSVVLERLFILTVDSTPRILDGKLFVDI